MTVQFVFIAGQLELLPTLMISLCAFDPDRGETVKDRAIYIGWLFFHIILRFDSK